jgi:hypothetical protein
MEDTEEHCEGPVPRSIQGLARSDTKKHFDRFRKKLKAFIPAVNTSDFQDLPKDSALLYRCPS